VKIKEQSSHRMVIGPNFGRQFVWILLLAAAIFLCNLFVPNFFPIVTAISVALGLHILGGLIGDNIIIDKLAESITVREQYLLFIPRKTLIPFSAVKYAWVVERTNWFGEGGISHQNWEVCLYYHGEKGEQSIKIDKTEDENKMRMLALDINNFGEFV